MSGVIDLVEYVERAEGVVGPEAQDEQEEDKERLLGTLVISVRVGKVWPLPRNSEQLQCNFYVGEHQHDEDEPEEDHYRSIEGRFSFGVAATPFEIKALAAVFFILCRDNHGHQSY